MITLEQVKIIREKKKDNPDQINLFGNNSGKKKKYTPPSKEKSDAIQSRSANRDAKKYASGEYAKIGGGERMSPKSKGPGASTGGINTPLATVGGKSKGTTPVKVNITKPVKQSEVSKKAKQFTTKINKANVNRKEFPGDKSGAYKRVKTDIETKNLLKKAGGSGDIGFTAPDRKTKVAKRTTRAVKQGTPDPFSTPTPKKPIRPFGDKPVTSSAPGFGKGMAGGQIKTKVMDNKSFKVTQPTSDLLPKSFKDFSKKIKKYRVERDIERKIKNPKLDISKVIRKRKEPVQQSIPGTGGNRNIKKTYNKRKPRQKPSSGGSSSKYTQGSLFDKPSGSGGSGGSGGGGKKGGSLGFPEPPKGGGSGGVDPEIVKNQPKGKFKITGDTYDNLSKGSKYKTFKQFGKEVDTSPGRKAFDARKVKRMSKLRYKGLGGKPSIQPVRRVLKPAAKALVGAAKRNPKTALIGGALALGAAYFGGKALTGRPGYDKNKIRQTGIIKDKAGQNVQFKYGDKKNPASPVLTKDYLDRDKKSKTYGKMLPGSLTKFRTGAYTAKDTKSGLNINIDKNMKGSAFEKQLQRAEKGTGFLGKQTAKDRTFLKKYKNATRPGTK